MELFNEDKIPKRTLGEVVILDNTITSPSIVNGSFLGGSITIGSGENVFRVDRNGIYLGSSSFATAPFRVDMQGNLVASSARIAGDIVSDNYVEGVSGYKLEYETGNAYLGNAIISGSSIIGDNNVLARTIGSSINQSGQFIKDVVNTNLSTATKQILGDFTFGSYGAIKMITDDNNGVWLSPTGILGKKAGATTFTIGADGNATFSGNVIGATITGGTIQTATSGKRIRMVSGAATTPNQNANSIALIDSDNNAIINIGTESSLLMSIRPEDDDTGLVVQAKDTLTYTRTLFSSSILDSDSTGIAGYFENNGTGDVVQIQADSTGIGLHITTAGTTSSSTDVVRIDSAKNGDSLKINKPTNYGRGLYINTTGTTNTYQPLYITNSGYGSSQITQLNNSSSTNSALLIEQYNGIKPPLHLTNVAVSTYFRRMIWLGSLTIWKSDGVTPNGNLSGSVGDICFGADSGKAYYCTGTTNWTSL